MWSPQSRTSSLTSSTSNVCGRTTPVSFVSASVQLEAVFDETAKAYLSRSTHKRPLIGLLTGEKWLYGCWFYRPNETFHLATRKFLEKEVFKSDYYNKAPVSKILGKCVVMFVKVKASFCPL